MWHKVSPQAFRIGYIKTWKSTGYYDTRIYGKKVSFDVRIRLFLQKQLAGIPIGNIFLNHNNDHISVVIYSSKISLILGQNDENIKKIEESLTKEFNHKFIIEVKEVKKPELSAAIVGEWDTITVATGRIAKLHLSDGSNLTIGSTLNQTVLDFNILHYNEDDNLSSQVEGVLTMGEVWVQAPKYYKKSSYD